MYSWRKKVGDSKIVVSVPSQEKENKSRLLCDHCKVSACFQRLKEFPENCPTKHLPTMQHAAIQEAYLGDSLDARMAVAAAEEEALYKFSLTRIEKTIAFANRIGAKKIGIAFCLALADETRVLNTIFKAHGLLTCAVICKVGSFDKSLLGIPEDMKFFPGSHESMCNPILQAQLLNEEKTDLNVAVGLCVGHDSLFYRHSEAPVTTLIAKDRLLGHNPTVPLYTSKVFYAKLFNPLGRL